ncbi:MAG: class I SAM-dependent methyltransferase [Anaerolineales bacterium]|jgi:ubiquinone/menaquinone biosynthesis C-methylase UbiE
MSGLSKFYDFYDGPEHREDQFAFYTSLFDPEECELLELACGTGIVTIELAQRGFQIVGIDYDEDMLALAKQKLDDADENTQRRVQFQCADMKDFAVSKQFGAIIIPTNSFGYLFKLEDQRACLEQVRKHLLPQGKLVIEERYFALETLHKMKNLLGVERTWTSSVNQQTGKYTMFVDCIRWIDSAQQNIYRSTYVDEVQEDGIIKRHVPSKTYFGNTQHYFSKNELQLLVEICGFKVKEIWGDMAKRPFGSRSNKIIIMAEKDD